MSSAQLTTGQAAEYLGISRQYMLLLLRDGTVRASRESTGPRDPYLVSIEELDRFKARQAHATTGPLSRARHQALTDGKG